MTVQSLNVSQPTRSANKSQAAEWFGVSLATIDNWIRRECPVTTRGNKGQAWSFDLRELAQWYYGRQASAAAGADGDPDPDSLDPKGRLDWYRGTREKMRHLQESGELIGLEDFRQGLARPFKLLANTVESLPDVLERDAGLTGAQVELCVKICDRLREDIYQQLVGGTGA